VEPGSERELVSRLKRGDIEAFDAVYEELRPRVYSFLVRLSKRRDLAEEILQETFVRLASRAATLTDDTRLSAWLFTVARNLYVSHVRSTLLETERLDQLSLEPLPHAPTPFEHAAMSEAQARVERALASLSEAHREVLLLVVIEQLEPQEAAAVVGISPEALRQRLSRARGLLKSALEEDTIEKSGGRHARSQ
jgi:RNA polymerase sigma factor (sigma-70 family)